MILDYHCTLHCVLKTFLIDNSRSRLSKTAVPSINLPIWYEEDSDNISQDNTFENPNPLECDGRNNIFNVVNDSESKDDPFRAASENSFNMELLIEPDAESENIVTEVHDVGIQTNLAYDEALKSITLLDLFHNDDELRSWTGIPSFTTLKNIVFCVESLNSAAEQLSKLKTSTENLVVLVMCKLRTNLYFTQLSVLFGVKANTLIKYFFVFVPILKAVLQNVVFWPSKEELQANIPNCFKEGFSDCVAIMDCTESEIERLKDLDSKIKTYSHYKGKSKFFLLH